MYNKHAKNITILITFIKAKLKKSDVQTNIDKIEWLHIKYDRISYQRKDLIYYIIKKLKNRILDIDIITF